MRKVQGKTVASKCVATAGEDNRFDFHEILFAQ